MKIPIDELKPGDLVQIAGGKWFEVTVNDKGFESIAIQTKRAAHTWIFSDLITDTHRGEKPQEQRPEYEVSGILLCGYGERWTITSVNLDHLEAIPEPRRNETSGFEYCQEIRIPRGFADLAKYVDPTGRVWPTRGGE